MTDITGYLGFSYSYFGKDFWVYLYLYLTLPIKFENLNFLCLVCPFTFTIMKILCKGRRSLQDFEGFMSSFYIIIIINGLLKTDLFEWRGVEPF